MQINNTLSSYPFIRELILIGLLLIFWACNDRDTSPSISESKIITVLGPVSSDSLGLTLIHEHVFLDWTPADSFDNKIWNEDEAFDVILPYLRVMSQMGVRSFLECTPAYLGRNPRLLQKLSRATGLQIITNTGFYGARQAQHIPPFAFDVSSDSLAAIWIKEFNEGIEGSSVRPGFIKIGMDSKDQLTPMDEKLVRAAARTHLATGLTIVSHTGDDTTAAQELSILAEEGVAPDAFVWTHAQRGSKEGHVRMAGMGAWVSLDGMGWIQPDSTTKDSSALFNYLGFLQNLREHQLLGKTLISHDAGWYTVGASDQNGYKPYTLIFELVIPMLKKRGFSEDDLNQLLIQNPQKAYAISIRKSEKL